MPSTPTLPRSEPRARVTATGQRDAPGRPINLRLNARVYEAVIDLLYREGYGALTMAKVAHEAGVSTATLYRRWMNKYELLTDAALATSNALVPVPDTGTFEDDLRSILLSTSTKLTGRHGIIFKAVLAQALHNPELAELVRKTMHITTDYRLAIVFRRAIERGEIHTPYDPDVAFHLVSGAMIHRFQHNPALPMEEELAFVESVLRHLLRAFGAVTK